MRNQIGTLATLACAIVLASGLSGCSSADSDDPQPEPTVKPSASATQGTVTRQDSPRDAQLSLKATSACRFEEKDLGATQHFTISGTIKNPVQAGIVLTVANASGAQAGTTMQVVRLDKPGKVNQDVVVTTQMSRQSWSKGFDECVPRLTWTPLADQ